MHRLSLLILALVASSAGALEAGSPFVDHEVSSSGRVLSPMGLFPLLENNAVVLGRGEAYLGTQFLGFGLGGRVQVGTNLFNIFFKTPNLSAKVLLLERPTLLLAAHLELMRLQENSDQFSASNFVSRFDPSAGYWVAPLGVSATWAPVKDLFLSGTLTAQGVASPALSGPQVTLGANTQLEWTVFKHHSLVMHAAEMGFYHHDYWQYGPSYRYHRWILDGSIGVVKRTYSEGSQPFWVASLGVEL